MSEKEEPQEFKIVDKRRFSADGNERMGGNSDVVQEPKKESISVSTNEKALPASSREDHDNINFSSFVLGLYTHTLIFLGDIPHPETNEVSKNLEAAKQNIDILTILEDKTKGNLTPEEAQLMKEVLDMLRLQFISKK